MTTSQSIPLLTALFEEVAAGSDVHAAWKDARPDDLAPGADASGLARIAGTSRRELFLPPDHPQRLLRVGDVVVDLAALRTLDVAGALLLARALDQGAPADLLRERFDLGDLDERVITLRALPWAGSDPVIQDLLDEAQRSNTLDLFEAGACDTNLAALHLDDAAFNRLVLRMAFLDLPLWRMLQAPSRANRELSRTLLDFAREREAAGRPVWADTLRLIARAPAPGAEARLLGSLEHGRSELRLAAAESLPFLEKSQLAPYLQERLDVELREDVGAALRRSLQQLGQS